MIYLSLAEVKKAGTVNLLLDAAMEDVNPVDHKNTEGVVHTFDLITEMICTYEKGTMIISMLGTILDRMMKVSEADLSTVQEIVRNAFIVDASAYGDNTLENIYLAKRQFGINKKDFLKSQLLCKVQESAKTYHRSAHLLKEMAVILIYMFMFEAWNSVSVWTKISRWFHNFF